MKRNAYGYRHNPRFDLVVALCNRYAEDRRAQASDTERRKIAQDQTAIYEGYVGL
jgi:hypothetical protein